MPSPPSSSSQRAIKSLYVTLRRGLAGVRESHRAVVTDGLGLRKRERTVKIKNNASNRGMVDKVRHLLSVETDEQRNARRAAEAARSAQRPPLEFEH